MSRLAPWVRKVEIEVGVEVEVEAEGAALMAKGWAG